MEKQSHLGEFFKYTSLNALGMIGLSCYILADTYFVSKGIGSNGLAALNLAIPVYGLINGSGLMLGIGGATQYSIAKSRGKTAEGCKAFTHSLILGICFALLFIAVGLFFSEPLTTFLGADRITFEMCRTYLRILLVFSPAFLLNNIILSFVRNDGAPQLAMAAMLSGSFSNVILDYIFIFPFDMGIMGAAVATGFSPIISLAVLSAFFIKLKNNFKPIKCRFSAKLCGRILSLGTPSLVTELSSGIVMFVFNTIILSLEGNTGVAAYGVIANISLVVISIYTGIAQGVQPLISKYYGSDDSKSVKLLLKYALVASVTISLVIYAFIFICAEPITAVFNSENSAGLQKIAVEGLRIYFTGCLFAGINILLAAYLAAANRAVPAGIISILRGFIVIILLAALLSNLWKLNGLWLSFPLTELLVCIVGAVMIKSKPRNLRLKSK